MTFGTENSSSQQSSITERAKESMKKSFVYLCRPFCRHVESEGSKKIINDHFGAANFNFGRMQSFYELLSPSIEQQSHLIASQLFTTTTTNAHKVES